MRWEVLIIPLIALGVWILGTLFRNEDDKTKKGVGRRGNVPGRASGRRVITDLDRFLDEARRRREPEARRKAPPSRVPPARSPARERPKQPKEPPRISTPVIVKEQAAATLPAPRPLAPSPSAEPVASPASAREMPPPAAPSTPISPIQQQVRSLLNKPQSAAVAFMLREIFDRPLCKRRRS